MERKKENIYVFHVWNILKSQIIPLPSVQKPPYMSHMLLILMKYKLEKVLKGGKSTMSPIGGRVSSQIQAGPMDPLRREFTKIPGRKHNVR